MKTLSTLGCLSCWTTNAALTPSTAEPTDAYVNRVLQEVGLVIADKPEGPHVKSKFNPITNSGHEPAMAIHPPL